MAQNTDKGYRLRCLPVPLRQAWRRLTFRSHGSLIPLDGSERTRTIIWRQASRFHTGYDHVWAGGKLPEFCFLHLGCGHVSLTPGCDPASLGWLEIQTIMAKIIYRYDLELVDKDLDWQRDSRMHTTWEKPSMRVRVKPASK